MDPNQQNNQPQDPSQTANPVLNPIQTQNVPLAAQPTEVQQVVNSAAAAVPAPPVQESVAQVPAPSVEAVQPVSSVQVTPAIAPQAPSQDPAPAASSGTKKNILIVDDEKETATIFQVGLSAGGYNVTWAENGQSGLDNAKGGKFDLILLDQMMPDMSGNDVLRALKADEATKNIPVAMLTNFGHDEMVKDALNLGANDYILKYRVEAADLVTKVQGIIGS